MRHVLTLFIFLFVLPVTLSAETRYVSEVREITLRTGPGADYKITSMVKSGTPMTVLEQSGEWTHVELSEGKDGWVLTQFLQSDVPNAILLEKLKKTHTALSAETDALRKENQDLREKVTALTSELDSCRIQFDALNGKHDALMSESAEFLQLQATYKTTEKELAAQKAKVETLENELSSLLNDKRLKWFLIGAGVLFTGIILGFITKPQRRRSLLV